MTMKLFPPQEEITLYETGFPAKDILERRHVGKQLSDLLEKIEDPLVVALEGPWGCGKTYFLKRWVGAHTLENGGKATTIYFDAFANDFLDDPLIALIGAIGDRLPKAEAGMTLKKVAMKLATPVSRIGISLVTAGISELVGPVLEATLAASSEEAEKAAEAFWKREDGRKEAMSQFRTALTTLTKESKKGADDGKPLIIVVDELDRCRPDYALSILEVIKHFFSVPHVHFVLGINLEALEQSVKARYGSGINASNYLKRFISISMVLPDFVFSEEKRHASIIYFAHYAEKMNIDQKIASETRRHIELITLANEVSLRDIDKILTRIALIPAENRLLVDGNGYITITISLIILQILDKNLYDVAIKRNIPLDKINDFYSASKCNEIDDKYRYGSHINILSHITDIWGELLTNNNKNEIGNHINRGYFGLLPSQSPGYALETINKNFLSTFSVND